MAKGKKRKKTSDESKPAKDKAKKPDAPSPVVAKARAAWVSGNYATLRKLHQGELSGDDKKTVDELYERTVTQAPPWFIAAGAVLITVIVGAMTLS